MSEFEAYRGLFVAESRENHENLVRNLLLLELGTDQNAIDEIFRSIHTLKGSSASMGFSSMEQLCHSMEDVLALIRSGTAEISPEVVNLLLACSDLIEKMLDTIEAGGDSSSENPVDMVNDLKEWIGQRGNGLKASRDLPGSREEDQVDPARDMYAENCLQYEMQIMVANECMMKDVRAMIALENVKSLGKILSVCPAMEAIDEGNFNGRVDLIIASDCGEEALKTAASGTEITEVIIRPVKKPVTVSAEQIPKGAKKTGLDKKQSSSVDKNREIKNLRVDIHQLDHIMNLIEDLVINRGRLKQIAGQYRIKEMDEAISMVDRSVSELQCMMMSIRMIPLNHIFNRLPRVVRDVARYDGKEVDFIIHGGETELDRSVMDGLNDPLLHLIRNAVNHGIESPAEREKSGKPQKGLIRLSAHRDRDNVIIELEDDGAGINIEKVRAKAVEKGLITQETADLYSREQAIDLLFLPGFSTADKISDISGRGVGLDVVLRSIESLKGTIRVETTLGKGSRFELVLPPTMAVVDVMIVRINNKRLGIPISSIVEVANFCKGDIHQIGKDEAILLRDEVLQILWLDDLAGASDSCEVLIVVQFQKRKCCLPVDIVEGKQEVVVKPLSRFIGNTRGVSGVTILGDGDVVPVIDVNTIL
ncbi:MAG: chemotaxis protein CheA [Methanoregula sp.]|nr:chemotaxis protein CheA [Methanoregula sp.]